MIVTGVLVTPLMVTFSSRVPNGAGMPNAEVLTKLLSVLIPVRQIGENPWTMKSPGASIGSAPLKEPVALPETVA